MDTLPDHLSSQQAMGFKESAPIAQYEIGGLRNFIYLILDWPTKSAAIVDPQKDLSAPFKALRHYGFTLKMVLLTHTHHDHVAGLPSLEKLFGRGEMPVMVHPLDRDRV